MSFSSRYDFISEIEIDGRFVSLYSLKYKIKDRKKYAIFIEGIEEPFEFSNRKSVDAFIKKLDMKNYFPDKN